MSKLDGIKAGDRVRVTFEGVYSDEYGQFGVAVLREAGVNTFTGKEIDDHTFKITRIEPAFAIGDEVLILGRHRNSNETVVGFLKDGRAIVEYQAGDTTGVSAYDISCLTHA